MHRFYHICHSFPSVSQANSHSSPRHVSPQTYRYAPFAPNPLQTTPFPSCPKKQGCLLCDRVYELPLMKCLLIVSNKLLSITFFQVVVTAKHDSFTFPPGISDSPISQTGSCLAKQVRLMLYILANTCPFAFHHFPHMYCVLKKCL